MQLAILTAVLAAIAAAEVGGGPVAGLAWRLAVIASAILIAPLAALVGTQRLAASLTDNDDAESSVSRLETIVTGLWLAAVALILFVGQWPRIVRSNWQLAGWPLIDELVILLPVIGSLVLVWSVMYRLDRSTYLAPRSTGQIAPLRLMSYLWLQARHHLALILLPPLAIVGVLETVLWLNIAPAKVDTAWWFVLPLAGMVLVLMPAAVRCLWQTTPMPGGILRERLENTCKNRNCRLREILIWNTGGTMANAAVVGMSRWLRYILLSDVLLARLTDDQIDAVVRHELGHLRRWHLPLRLAALLLPVALWLVVKHIWPQTPAAIEAALASLGLRASAVTAVTIPLALLAYAVIVLGWYSRLLEHDADLDACTCEDGRVDAVLAADFCTALVTLCGRSHESWLSRWLHPPLDQRLAFLRRAISTSGIAPSFRRRTTLLALAIAAILAAACGAALLV